MCCQAAEVACRLPESSLLSRKLSYYIVSTPLITYYSCPEKKQVYDHIE